MIVGLIGIVTILAVYYLYLRPKKEVLRYKKILQAQGYKVFVYPVTLKPSVLTSEAKSLALHSDSCHHHKHMLTDYDVAVYNIMGKVGLQIMNIELIKDLFAPDKVDTYHKLTYLFGGMT
jgi:hypothetical protein